MFFGKKIKELRLKYSEIGLRKFANKIDMKPSELSNIERGFTKPPQDIEWMWKIIYALGLEGDVAVQLEFINMFKESFVMQEMEEDVIPAFVCTTTGKPIEEEKFEELCEWINIKAKEHNQKAREYNKEHHGI